MIVLSNNDILIMNSSIPIRFWFCNEPNFLLGSLCALWSPKYPHEIHLSRAHAFRWNLFAPPVSATAPPAELSVSSPGAARTQQPIHPFGITACADLSNDPWFGEN